MAWETKSPNTNPERPNISRGPKFQCLLFCRNIF